MSRLLLIAALLALSSCKDAPTSQDTGVPADSGPSCSTLCSEAATRCAGIDAMQCEQQCSSPSTTLDAGNRTDVRGCLAASTEMCTRTWACLSPVASRPFSTGPYGTKVKDIAAPFTVPTPQGDWSFADQWSGNDSYLFVAYAPRLVSAGTNADYSTLLFQNSIADLVAGSPRNVHYFILWLRDEPGFTALRDGLDADLAALTETDRAYWKPRIHFVTTRGDLLTDWLGPMIRTRMSTSLPYKRYDAVQFGIDRFQRIREVGQLGTLSANGINVELNKLANEATYYNFEFDREQALRARMSTVIPLADKRTVHDTFDVDVDLPDTQMMSTFDTLEVDLTTDCPNHRDGECGAWDYLSHLWLCEPETTTTADAGIGADVVEPVDASDASNPSDVGGDAGPRWRCDREMARWITTYWREGRWVTDISPMLAHIRQGGRQHFRWYASGQWDPRATDYLVSLSLRLSNRARGMHPVRAIPLWSGADWNGSYDTGHPPVSVMIPATTRRVELYTLITGHGGVQPSNCAEFCNHEHHFTVNASPEHRVTFPEARGANGCESHVDAGVVPNQHGTWYYGRGGWCPGFDVAPRIFDVTAETRLGALNTFSYTTTYQGRSVVGSLGNLVVTTYVVLWE